MPTPDRDSYYNPSQGGDVPGYPSGKRIRTYKLTLLGDEVHELYVRDIKPTDATATRVSSSASSVTLAAANPNRMGLFIYNDSDNFLYVKLGSAASMNTATVKLATQTCYSLPAPVFVGAVYGIWNVAQGAAVVTEVYENETLT